MSGSIVVMQMSTVPWSARSAGTWAVHSALSTVAPWSPATTSYQYQPPSTNGFRGSVNVNVPGLALDRAGVDALGVAARHRLVDRDGRPGTGHVDRQLHLGDDGVATPVGRREGVEVGAERQQLRRLEPQRGARADLVGVQLATGRGGLADGGVVEVLGPLVATDLEAVGVELGLLEVDVEGEDVGVAVDREDLPLEQPGDGAGLGVGAHASMPPLVSSAPSVKCGLSLLSYIDSAAPMAMCMSRYL